MEKNFFIAKNKCPKCGKSIEPKVTEFEDDGETPKVALVKCGYCGFEKKYDITHEHEQVWN